MRLTLCILLIAAFLAVAISPRTTVQACPSGAFVDNQNPCSGDINGVNDTANSLTNEAIITNGGIVGGNAVTATTSNVIINTSTGSLRELDGGDLSSSFDQTNTVTNRGLIVNNSGDAFIVGGESSTTSTGAMTNTISNTGNIIGNLNAYVYAGDQYTSANSTNVLFNSGTISSTYMQAYFEGSEDYGSGTVTNTLTNSGSITTVGSDALIYGGDIYTSGNVVNSVTSSGSISAFTNGGYALAYGGDAYNGSTGSVTNLINISGSISASDNSGGAYVYGGDVYTSSTANVTNNINISGSVSTDNNSGDAYVYGGDNRGSGNLTSTINISGSVTASDNSGDADVYGGDEHSGSTANMTNTINISGSVTASNSGDAYVYGGDNQGSGNLTNTIKISGVVGGDVTGGGNYGSGTTTNLVILSGYSPTISGTIYGDNHTGASATLSFQMITTNEGLYRQFLADFASKNPAGGSITWGGKTYYWQDFDQLQDLVKFLLIVTWFNPGDNRIDPRAGDHVAAYCNLDKGTVGVYVIGSDSKGNNLTSFAIADLRAAGKAGITHNLSAMGSVSLSVDGLNNFWLAWNGGPLGANGQGDFAKAFNCAFK